MTAASSPRLVMLEQLVVSKSDDPFPKYGLAMELKKLGVPERSMYAAGYGEWMPRVANRGKKGHPENRRVEIAVVDKK